MANITKIHENVLEFLEKKRVDDDDLLFTLRRSNRGNKLNDGYWFYGNEDYVAFSFWSGTDWKNKTPNIIFVIYANGYCFLELTSQDSVRKESFFRMHLADQLEGIYAKGKKWFVDYSARYPDLGAEYLDVLEKFLTDDKLIIDKAVEQGKSYWEDQKYEIGQVNLRQFHHRLERIHDLQKLFLRLGERVKRKLVEGLRLHEFRVRNFACARDVHITNIPLETQWIFLSGDNGSGKSTILQGLAAALATTDPYFDSSGADKKGFSVDLRFSYGPTDQLLDPIKFDSTTEMSEKIITAGLACYGSSRVIQADASKHRDEALDKKATRLYSLFNPDGILKTPDAVFAEWDIGSTKHAHKMRQLQEPRLVDRIDIIKETLTELIETLVDINFAGAEHNQPGTSHTKYYEAFHGGEPKERSFDQLSSGNKAIVAMIGDLLIRLFDGQEGVDDVAELCGIVIIDEIGIHLSPHQQKFFVEQLTKTFQKIQFIVSTHSPLALLGAPKKSLFYHVEMSPEHEIQAKRIDIDISGMHPNVLLTSPIFGLEELFSAARGEEGAENLISDDFYPDHRKHVQELDSLLRKYKARKNREKE
jgi:predicted ATPase